MSDLVVVAESAVHPGRRLLRGHDGQGYLQLTPQASPFPLSAADFRRLCAMRHYRARRPALAFAAHAPREEYDLAD